MLRERFAPSPTGHLHLGHAYSALLIWDSVRKSGGEFILRIEDIDFTRTRAEYETSICNDLRWLGIEWTTPVLRQSERMPAYAEALAELESLGLCFPCRCSRRDIRSALSAPQERPGGKAGHPQVGAEYPGTCRGREMRERTAADAVRLDMQAAIQHLGGPKRVNRIDFVERGQGNAGRRFLDAAVLAQEFGDVVLARKDIGTSYHLSVVVDDAAQGITRVTRGEDLLAATALHRLLQEILELPVPEWNHHRLIRDGNGARLAKRDDARSIRALRDAGAKPAQVREMVGL